MLFWVEGDLGRVAELGARSESRSGLSNLVDSAIAGDHVLFGAREYLTALIKSGFINDKEISFLAAASQRLTQEGRTIVSLPKVRVSVDYEETQLKGKEWLVPLSVFSDSNVLRMPFLLAENIRDARLYLAFSRKWMAETLPSYLVKLFPVHGGGGTTGEVFSGYIADGYPATICIVDSDRKCSTDPIGQTARGCLNATEGNERWQFCLNILGAREFENIIPAALRKNILSGMSAFHHETHDLLLNVPDEVALHVCLKEGDSFCRFYASGVLHKENSDDSEVACVLCGRSSACEVTSGFGSRYLFRVLESISDDVAIPSIEYWHDSLRDTAIKVAFFGIGSGPQRLISSKS
ncbi:MAG: hypothetical protein ABL934_07600 [Lysobacteraceae bacterium]